MNRNILPALLLSLAPVFAVAADEPYRPLYHFTPAKNWMNDPNGMVWHDGEWHLFYQYNPFGDKWGHMSWGHAVSRNLLTWEHLPLALAEEDGIMIFSGSAVVDEKNTSGFGQDGQPPLVAIYTGHREGRQDQRLAYSNDRGRTWTKFPGNPVLDVKMADFRDPKVFWHEATARWVMTVALSAEHKVHFYTSPDLKAWQYAGEFGSAGATGGLWECPDLFPLAVEGGTKWVLIVNINPGGPSGGSAGQYFVGDFDGKTFTAYGPGIPASTPAVEPAGEVLADFEKGYGDWKATGNCFGDKPAAGRFDGQHPLPGFKGAGLVNTFLKGDASQGTLTSPAFTIGKDWLSFLIGGGAQAGKTCVNLKVGGKVVHSATGHDNEALDWVSWNVSALRGQQAQIEIVDAATGGWGHVNADHFVAGDAPAFPARQGALWLDHGPDFYAGITWSGGPPGDSRRILLGWMSNWQYANDVPTSPWRSAMSLPRELTLRKAGAGYRLAQQPVREIATLGSAASTFTGGSMEQANAWLTKEQITGDKLDLTVTLAFAADKTAALDVLADGATATKIIANSGTATLSVDRTHSGNTGFHPDFSRIATAPLLLPPGNEITLRILIDACSVEVFTADGLTALTTLVLPPPGARNLRINSAGNVRSITVRPLGPSAR